MSSTAMNRTLSFSAAGAEAARVHVATRAIRNRTHRVMSDPRSKDGSRGLIDRCRIPECRTRCQQQSGRSASGGVCRGAPPPDGGHDLRLNLSSGGGAHGTRPPLAPLTVGLAVTYTGVYYQCPNANL